MTGSYSTVFDSNTKLHTAIDLNQTALALQYIIEDVKNECINVKSLDNTPLLLALKKGNMQVAEALVINPNVDIFAKDCRGLTALHWACMLRQNKIIKALLDRGADPHLATVRWADPMITEPFEMTPLALYERSVLLQNFANYVYFNDIASSGISADKFRDDYTVFFNTFFGRNDKKYKHYAISGFADRNDLHIPGEMAYTDIIFHLKDLCENLNWKSKDVKFVSHGDNGYLASNSVFAKNFAVGIKGFCESRNAITIDAQLLEKMKNAVPDTKVKPNHSLEKKSDSTHLQKKLHIELRHSPVSLKPDYPDNSIIQKKLQELLKTIHGISFSADNPLYPIVKSIKNSANQVVHGEKKSVNDKYELLKSLHDSFQSERKKIDVIVKHCSANHIVIKPLSIDEEMPFNDICFSVKQELLKTVLKHDDIDIKPAVAIKGRDLAIQKMKRYQEADRKVEFSELMSAWRESIDTLKKIDTLSTHLMAEMKAYSSRSESRQRACADLQLAIEKAYLSFKVGDTGESFKQLKQTVEAISQLVQQDYRTTSYVYPVASLFSFAKKGTKSELSSKIDTAVKLSKDKLNSKK